MPQNKTLRFGAMRSGTLRPAAFFSSSEVGFLNCFVGGMLEEI